VPVESQHGVVTAHAGAIIADLDQHLSAVFQLDPDVRGSGIECILHQLFHDGCRAFHHLAGSDLIGYSIGQDGNASAHGQNLSADARDAARGHPSLPRAGRLYQCPTSITP
jgi:hypothetical protein